MVSRSHAGAPTLRLTHLLAALLLGPMLPSAALASPWTLPDEELVFSLGYDFQRADEEFLPAGSARGDGARRPYPLNGEFSSSSLNFSTRYGFTDNFEGEVLLTLKHVSYTSAPFLPRLPDAEPDGSIDPIKARQQLVNFSDSRLGPADFYLFGRYNLLRSQLMITSETAVKFPTGYTQPEPNIITLGDGQVDLRQQILAGIFLPATNTFARAEVGFNLRTGLPGHQVLSGLKIGQLFGPKFILFVGASSAITVTEGDIGPEPTPQIIDPSTPPEQLGADDLRFIDFTLDKDFLRVEAGIILRFGVLEVQVGYNQIVWGRNIPVLQGLSVSSLLSASTATEEAARPSKDTTPDKKPEVETEIIYEEVPVEEEIPVEEEVPIEEEKPDDEGEPKEEPRAEPAPEGAEGARTPKDEASAGDADEENAVREDGE